MSVVPLILVPLTVRAACKYLVNAELFIAISQKQHGHNCGCMQQVLKAFWWPFCVFPTHPQQPDSLL